MLWVCLGCGTRYLAGLAACPHCGSGECVADFEAEEAGMAKITLGGGPSFHPEVPALEDADAVVESPAVAVPAVEPETAEPAAPADPDPVPEPEVRAAPSLSRAKDE